MEGAKITLKYELDPSEMAEAMLAHDRLNVLSPRKRLIHLLLGLAAGVMASWAWQSWIMLVAIPLLIALLQVSFYIARPRQARAMFDNPNFRGPYEVTFDQEGSHGRNAVQQSSTRWEGYRSVIETPRTFVFFRGTYDYAMVPKRAFSADQEEAFRKLVNEKISGGISSKSLNTVDVPSET